MGVVIPHAGIAIDAEDIAEEKVRTILETRIDIYLFN